MFVDVQVLLNMIKDIKHDQTEGVPNKKNIWSSNSIWLFWVANIFSFGQGRCVIQAARLVLIILHGC